MSSDSSLILRVIPSGKGVVLDLGGGKGILRRSLEARGYRYINMDMRNFDNGEPSLVGDAHRLPFREAILDMVVSKDTLEHFLEPKTVVQEVHRVLKKNGQFIIWVPFMHPFHGDDFFRYSPLGLRHMLQNFEVLTFESPLWVFTIVGLAAIEILRGIHLGFLDPSIRTICSRLDHLFMRHRQEPASFACAYRIVARKP